MTEGMGEVLLAVNVGTRRAAVSRGELLMGYRLV